MKTTHKYIAKLLIAGLLIGLSACTVPINTASGTKIDQSKLATIVKGTTTRQEIERMFGPPMNVALLPDGRRTMQYTYTAMSGSGSMGFMAMSQSGQTSMRQESLQVILTRDGIVEDFEFSGSTQDSTQKIGIGGMQSQSVTR